MVDFSCNSLSQSITCHKLRPHGSTLDAVLKRLDLARMGSERMARLWHSCLLSVLDSPLAARLQSSDPRNEIRDCCPDLVGAVLL